MTRPPSPQDVLAAVRDLTQLRDGAVDIDHSRSAAAMETVGRAMADALRPHRPETVLTWDDSDNAVLGHVLARESGVPAVPFRLQDGVIDVDVELVRGRRVALAVLHGVPAFLLRQVRSYLDAHQATLEAVAEAVGPRPSGETAVPHHLVLVDQHTLTPAARDTGTDHAH